MSLYGNSKNAQSKDFTSSAFLPVHSAEAAKQRSEKH